MNIELIEHSCISCGISFWINKEHDVVLRKNKSSFYCPNGHQQSYMGETDKEKLKKEQEKTKELRLNVDHLENEINLQTDQIKKLKAKKKKKPKVKKG